MGIDNQDHVWTDTDDENWIVRITIPGMSGEVEVVNKIQLTESEMESLNTESFKPDELVINFYIRESNPDYCAVTSFASNMVLEVKYDEDNETDLGFADLDERKWIPFTEKDHNYVKEGGVATVSLGYWPADPPVAWGFR
jgi:hypothetical protein